MTTGPACPGPSGSSSPSSPPSRSARGAGWAGRKRSLPRLLPLFIHLLPYAPEGPSHLVPNLPLSFHDSSSGKSCPSALGLRKQRTHPLFTDDGILRLDVFEHGRLLSSPLLTSDGKVKQVRWIELRPGDDIPVDEIAILIAEAIALRA